MATNLKVRSLAFAAAAVALGLGSQDAMAATQTGHASAAIVQAIAVTENTPINFGFIVAPAAGGTVTLSAANVISGAGFSFLGGNQAGQFTATGTTGEPVVISFSSGDTLTGPGTAMPLGTYTTDAGASPVFATGNTFTFHVGANLTVGSNQTAGNYSGTYTVTVNY